MWQQIESNRVRVEKAREINAYASIRFVLSVGIHLSRVCLFEFSGEMNAFRDVCCPESVWFTQFFLYALFALISHFQ